MHTRVIKHNKYYFFIHSLFFILTRAVSKSTATFSSSTTMFLPFLSPSSFLCVRIASQLTRCARDNIRCVISYNSRFFVRYDVCRKTLVIGLFVMMKPEYSPTEQKLRLLIISSKIFIVLYPIFISRLFRNDVN